MEKQTESKTTIKVFPGHGLALALALPRVPVEAVRQSLLSRLPFLGLDRHGRRSVWGTVSDAGFSMAMPWPGPRVFSWPAHPQAVAAEAPPETHLSTKPFRNNQASTGGFPAIGLMISGTTKRQPGTGGAPHPHGGRLSTQRLSPALFGLLSQKGDRRATKVTAQMSVATLAIHRQRNATPSSAIMRSQLEPTPAAIASIENGSSGSQPANNTGMGTVQADSGTGAISQSENIPAMSTPIVNSIAGPLGSAPIGPMNSILRLLPALRLNSLVERDGLPRLGSSPIYSTVSAGAANKQERRVLPQPEVRMSQREVVLRRGLTVMADAVEVMVQRQVKAAIERQVDATMSQVSSGGPSSGGIKAADFASDEMARALMQKMRDLAQEDRFRCGKLR